MEFPEEDIPVRQFMDDPDIQWRTGSRPDYTQVGANTQWGMRSHTEYTQVGVNIQWRVRSRPVGLHR